MVTYTCKNAKFSKQCLGFIPLVILCCLEHGQQWLSFTHLLTM